ncbi:hypothetical protein BS47DRAFT_1359176 [Hydnum rufescens UP504]|uniref:Uncharacterized protein n=1 Tax=Hydnum rufescens UP504 TaxID=1448309 RepID=A0A9P6B5R7_9AGAM|nr:hypothetical protein BS47DRAFT_1359176 [Hydnum rufescens UP504]
MTSLPSHPFLLCPGQSQCLALFAAPPPEASAKGVPLEWCNGIKDLLVKLIYHCMLQVKCMDKLVPEENRGLLSKLEKKKFGDHAVLGLEAAVLVHKLSAKGMMRMEQERKMATRRMEPNSGSESNKHTTSGVRL